MMNTYPQTSRKKTNDSLVSMPIHTTLYDLIAAIDAEAGPDADDVVTATVIHLLNTYRVSCLGNFEGCQMISDDEDMSSRAVPRHAGLAMAG
jgi:hypothetical protein